MTPVELVESLEDLPYGGEAFCRPLFGDRVAWLVGAHVPTKRYLVAVNDAYEP